MRSKDATSQSQGAIKKYIFTYDEANSIHFKLFSNIIQNKISKQIIFKYLQSFSAKTVCLLMKSEYGL